MRWDIFHFDGSAKAYPKVGMVGGLGSCHLGHWEFSSPLNTLEKQTNNGADLKAAISAALKVTRKTVDDLLSNCCFTLISFLFLLDCGLGSRC